MKMGLIKKSELARKFIFVECRREEYRSMNPHWTAFKLNVKENKGRSPFKTLWHNKQRKGYLRGFGPPGCQKRDVLPWKQAMNNISFYICIHR